MSHIEYTDDGHKIELEADLDLQLHALQLNELDCCLDNLRRLIPVTHLEVGSTGMMWWVASDGRSWQQTIRQSSRGWEEGGFGSDGWFVDRELEATHAVAHHVIRLSDEYRLTRLAVDW